MSAGHTHTHGHDHSHSHAPGSIAKLLLALCLTLSFAGVEAVGGWLAGSLALMSDAGHMLSDASALGIGALAAWLARRPVSKRHSFGLQRAEVMGALLNALLMGAVVAAVAIAAVQRLMAPAPVTGGAVMIIAAIGLLVNLLVAAILMRGEQTMNVRAALLHVLGDLLGSVAALTAGAVVYFTGWTPIDPLLSLLVAALILISAVRLLREVLQVLMEGVPRDVDTDAVGSAMAAVDGVEAVHDMHIWTISSKERALAAHVDVPALDHWERVLPHLQQLLRDRFGITHATLQPEDDSMRAACAAQAGCGAQTV